MNTTLLALASLTIPAAITFGQSVELTLAEGGNGHRYELIVRPGGLNWFEADALANSLGGHLATITSTAESQFVFDRLVNNQDAWFSNIGPWLGGRQPADAADVDPSLGWTWVTGEAWDFTMWAPNQPDGSFHREDYLHFGGTAFSNAPEHNWNDLRGDGLTNGLVVEYVPVPGSGVLLAICVLATSRRRSR
jgi:hypothetical protein